MRLTRRGVIALLILGFLIGMTDWSMLVYAIHEWTNIALPGQPTL